MRSAFSLVELSIVLVILGLLTGGILGGQSLIRAAELRAVSTEYQRYSGAVYTFRDKYFQLPGDFSNATRFWLRQAATADCVTNSSASVGTPGVCDGNGDGNIDSGNASQAQERFQFWRHLQQAGLVEGSLSGSAGSGAANHMIVGTNVPPSKLGAAGWSPGGRYDNTGASGTIDFYINYGQHFLFGGMNANSSLRASALKPEEAWNIDTKLDDGKPARGKVVSPQWTTCTNAADGSVLAADYALNANTIACILMFPNAF